MFARIKKSGKHQYLQVVHNERIDGQVRQRVIATLGRLDVLKETGQLDGLLESWPDAGAAAYLHACTHTTFSPNVVHGGVKTNVIPDIVSLDVDIRTMPGDHTDEVTAHLRAALGDELFERVDVDVLMDDPASTSRTSSLRMIGNKASVTA